MDNWYSAPIIPSSNHINDSPISLTFKFRPYSSTDSITGVIELICPIEVTCVTTSVTQAVTGDEDGSVVFSGITVTAGTFGPFGLVTRDQSNGSIVDANYVFGHITILNEIGTEIITVSSSDTISSIGIQE